MQVIIKEGSDHIKDLELKIKTQGKDAMNVYIMNYLCIGQKVKLPFER